MKQNIKGHACNLAWVFLTVCTLLFASCGHRKGASKDNNASIIPGAETGALADKAVSVINAQRLTESCITAKASIKLKAAGKDMGVSGTLRMKRDDVIQISLAFLGLMEVGRMELTQEYFLLVDRMNHQYVRVAYEDVPFLKQSGIDFHTFQSLFWNELFLPGDGGKAPSADQFKQTVSGDSLLLTYNGSTQAALHFIASLSQATLLQTYVTDRNNTQPPLMSWDYSASKAFGNKKFPTYMLMKLNAGKSQVQLALSLSNIKNNSDWETRTTINTKKYKEVPLESIIKRIQSMSVQ